MWIEIACRRRSPQRNRLRDGKGFQMFDLILLALGLAFFVLSVAYAYACDRL